MGANRSFDKIVRWVSIAIRFIKEVQRHSGFWSGLINRFIQLKEIYDLNAEYIKWRFLLSINNNKILREITSFYRKKMAAQT